MPPTNEEPTATKLERLVLALVTIYNTRDWTFTSPGAQELLFHIHPDWTACMDNNVRSWSQQIEEWKQRQQLYPETRMTVQDLSSSVDEKNGTAVVFLSMQVGGLQRVTLHAMNECRWRRIEGKWWFCFVLGMRGSMANAG